MPLHQDAQDKSRYSRHLDHAFEGISRYRRDALSRQSQCATMCGAGTGANQRRTICVSCEGASAKCKCLLRQLPALTVRGRPCKAACLFDLFLTTGELDVTCETKGVAARTDGATHRLEPGPVGGSFPPVSLFRKRQGNRSHRTKPECWTLSPDPTTTHSAEASALK